MYLLRTLFGEIKTNANIYLDRKRGEEGGWDKSSLTNNVIEAELYAPEKNGLHRSYKLHLFMMPPPICKITYFDATV